ncbi:titin [Micractinium conductrix]|uniref:Titin n=1 Tax=Micractinium conductrix TaxID=554055 RepID=A0A2P6VJD7_9CHLO|nr:titin [Micractinium conductrix]|eukprot:PSC74188.1 titin [Micractinium conductrix]
MYESPASRHGGQTVRIVASKYSADAFCRGHGFAAAGGHATVAADGELGAAFDLASGVPCADCSALGWVECLRSGQAPCDSSSGGGAGSSSAGDEDAAPSLLAGGSGGGGAAEAATGTARRRLLHEGPRIFSARVIDDRLVVEMEYKDDADRYQVRADPSSPGPIIKAEGVGAKAGPGRIKLSFGKGEHLDATRYTLVALYSRYTGDTWGNPGPVFPITTPDHEPGVPAVTDALMQTGVLGGVLSVFVRPPQRRGGPGDVLKYTLRGELRGSPRGPALVKEGLGEEVFGRRRRFDWAPGQYLNGRTYLFTATATNVAGTSDRSRPAVPVTTSRHATIPSAPTILNVRLTGAGTLSVALSPPTVLGSPGGIRKYVLQGKASDGGAPVAFTGSPAAGASAAGGGAAAAAAAAAATTILIVPSGSFHYSVTYSFTVQAENSEGLGRASQPPFVHAVPADAPGPPTVANAAGNQGSIEVFIGRPLVKGGPGEITSWRVEGLPQGHSGRRIDVVAPGTVAPKGQIKLIVPPSGYAPGRPYRLFAYARNSAGWSRRSVEAFLFTPPYFPAPPPPPAPVAWAVNECSTDKQYRAPGFRFPGGTVAGGFSSASLGARYNGEEPMYLNNDKSTKRCTWWSVAAGSSLPWWGVRVVIPEDAFQSHPELLVVGSNHAPRAFPDSTGKGWVDWFAHSSTRVCARLDRRTAVAAAGSTMDLACRDSQGRPVSIGTRYFVTFAVTTRGTRNVPRWGKVSVTVAPAPPRTVRGQLADPFLEYDLPLPETAAWTAGDAAPWLPFSVSDFAGAPFYTPDAAMYTNDVSTQTACVWWWSSDPDNFGKPATRPNYFGVRLTLPALRVTYPIMVFVVSSVKPPAFTRGAADWGTFFDQGVSRVCAVLSQSLALNPEWMNTGSATTINLPCRETDSQTTFSSGATYIVGFAIDDLGSKDVPLWGGHTLYMAPTTSK